MVKSTGHKKINTSVFISGYGTNLRNLIKFAKRYNSPIKITFVVSSKKNAKGLVFSKKHNIDSKFYSFKKKKN
tara:strand:+ start:493 stop:711 length:219 start_codon:yes stop_codon:yes gene_type:complete